MTQFLCYYHCFVSVTAIRTHPAKPHHVFSTSLDGLALLTDLSSVQGGTSSVSLHSKEVLVTSPYGPLSSMDLDVQTMTLMVSSSTGGIWWRATVQLVACQLSIIAYDSLQPLCHVIKCTNISNSSNNYFLLMLIVDFFASFYKCRAQKKIVHQLTYKLLDRLCLFHLRSHPLYSKIAREVDTLCCRSSTWL